MEKYMVVGLFALVILLVVGVIFLGFVAAEGNAGSFSREFIGKYVADFLYFFFGPVLPFL